MKITRVLTDNGSQLIDRFAAKIKIPSGQHVFDRQCTAFGIEHRLSPRRQPKTDSVVERFNGRIVKVIKQTRFASAIELESTLTNDIATYNHRIPQRCPESSVAHSSTSKLAERLA